MGGVSARIGERSGRIGIMAAMLLMPVLSQTQGTLPPHIAEMNLTTPKPVSEAQMAEFKQDFVDVDFNKDDEMDAQEVRAHFEGKGGIGSLELYHFFLDSDKDQTGTTSLQEYVDYASMLG
mmetsp:Transcript_962/g.1285  ORF Transcript_962/g.1285 Transcript_962/m.1285 type:complete len:121 (+) Transcript_962:37-399(+)